MENKIDKYFFISKNNNEYILYFIQKNNDNYEIYFDLKNNEFDSIKYKKTNLFEQFEVLSLASKTIIFNLHKYPNKKFYIKIFNKQFKYIYDYIVESHYYNLFYDIEINDDYMIFIKNDVTIP
jgi:hypothetical protein